jgi:hypothetical protein
MLDTLIPSGPERVWWGALAAVVLATLPGPAGAQREGADRAPARSDDDSRLDPRVAWLVHRETEPETGAIIETALLGARTISARTGGAEQSAAPPVILGFACATLASGAPRAEPPAPEAKLMVGARPEATGTWPEATVLWPGTRLPTTMLDLRFGRGPTEQTAHLFRQADGSAAYHIVMATRSAKTDVPALFRRVLATDTLTARIRLADAPPLHVRFVMPPRSAATLRRAFAHCQTLRP